jgi:alpha-glucosidase
MLAITVLSILSMAFPIGQTQSQWLITSPDGNLKVYVTHKALGEPYSAEKNLYYRVELAGQEILRFSPLGITAGGDKGDFVNNLKFVSMSSRVIDETYPMIVGKKSLHRNNANEMTINFKNKQKQLISVIFRAYNDGFAYRYRLVGSGACEIISEASAFRLPENCVAWLQDYKPDYQGYYPKRTNSDKITTDIGFPALFKTPEGQWVLLTEAAVYGNYAAARLTGTMREPCIFKVKLPEGNITGELPLETTWRVGIVGSTLGPIVESVLVDNLNLPCELQDLSWIKPGRVAMPWLTAHSSHNQYETLEPFVVLAADMGWEWIEIESGHIGVTVGFEGTDNWMRLDWLPKLVEYAKSKNVDAYGWENWKQVYTQQQRDRILPTYVNMGIKGIKADFIMDDSQKAMKWYDAFTQDCAKHKLLVSFHGATLPKGQQRRWPNIMTWEAVLGEEWHTLPNAKNPCPPPTPEFNCELPFTRNVVGSMDYTPVVFSIPDKKTTNAHELALAIIFESAWQCIADSPASYNASPAKPFLKEVPATWDDIHFIDGQPDEFCCLARLKGNNWYLAAINAGTARTLKIPLNFLKQGTYPVTLYKDDAQAKDIAVENITLDTSKPFEISIPPNGGFCMKIVNSK